MQTAKDEELEVPLAPLIDIVFLLIIFFVITASMQNEQIDQEVKLAKSYHVPPEEETPAVSVIINVRQTDAGEVIYNIANIRMSLPEIKNQLLMVKSDQHGQIFPVIIRASRDVKWKEIEKLNVILGEVGMYEVIHSSESRKGE